MDSLQLNKMKPAKALYKINIILKKTDLAKYKKASLFEYQGELLESEQNLYAAIDAFNESFKLYQKIRDKKKQISVLNNIAELYIEIDDFSNAFTTLDKVQELIEKLRANSDFDSTPYLINMANMFFKTGKIKKSHSLYLQSISKDKELNKPHLLHKHYLKYADFLLTQNKIDSALYYSNLVLNYSDLVKNKKLAAKSHLLLGKILEKNNDFILAENHYKNAVHILDSVQSNSAFVYKQIGNFYKRVYLYDYADKYLRKAVSKYTKDNKIEEIQGLYHDLVENSILQRKYLKANWYLKKYDSVHFIKERQLALKNIQFVNERYKIQQAEINYLNDRNTLLQKESELVSQKNIAEKNKTISIILFILLLFIAFGGYTYYRYYKLKIEKSNVQLKNTVLRLQMNPHFIFNSLTAIQNAILKNDQLKSAELIAIFSKLIRQNLDFSNKKCISLNDEIDMLSNYLETQKFRFNNMFDYQINIDENIDQEETKLPPMLLQPFIENSIEHGLKHRGEGGLVKLSIERIEKGIKVLIEDNGIGRKSAQINNKNHDSKDKIHAIKIFKERLKIRQKKEIESFKISDILDDENKVKGTIVEFIIKD